MPQKIKLTTDSACDLTKEQLSTYNVSQVVPLYITMGDMTIADGTFKTESIYSFVQETGHLPKTSAINTYDFVKCFTDQTKDGSEVLHFSISSEISACYQNATKAAAEVGGVHVIDAKQLSSGTSLLLIYAHELLKNNPEMTAKEAAEILRELSQKIQSSFCVDTITYLYKGGRCSALSLLGANLLKIHPSLHLKNGFITVGKKYRGKMSVVVTKYIEDLRNEYPNYDKTRCFITYTQGTSEAIVEAARKATKELFDFEQILESVASSTITSHCGAGTIGLLFMNK